VYDGPNQISIVTIGVSRAAPDCGVDPEGISHPTRRFRIELMPVARYFSYRLL
jgi:hypothetical protein